MALEPEDGFAPPPAGGEVRLPDPPGHGEEAEGPPSPSLLDDLIALVDDARTYVEAELAFQKTRVRFVLDRVKKVVAFVAVAAFLAVLATIGLTVGLIIALTPLVTAWGATAIVVGVLLLLAYLLVRRAGETWGNMMAEIRPEDAGEEESERGGY